MSDTEKTETMPMFRFRVLLKWHPEYKVFSANCLETGNVITADNIDIAQSMIAELLEDEIEFALKRGTLRNLTSNPCSLLVWKEWLEAVKNGHRIIKKNFSHSRTSIGTVDTQISIVVAIDHDPPPAP